MKKPEEMSDVELVGYFEGETIAYGTAAAGSKEESDADAHGEAAKAELLRRLGAAVLASAHPRCPMHKTEMVQKINGIPFWVCSTDGCDLFISAEIIKQVAQFFAAAPAQEPPPDLLVQDLAMLVRRLLRKHPNLELVAQAKDFLMRKGLQGSILRTAAQEQPVENSPTVNIDCLKCESPLGWNPERGWFHINESSCSGVSGVTDMQRPAFTQKEAK